MIFDSHCHPQMAQYDKDRDEVIQRALGERVFMICVGTDLETSKEAIELAQKYEGIWASVGLHPNDIGEDEAFIKSSYAEIINTPKVVAVGEVGLDYYRTPEPKKQEKQKEVFENFLDLAIKHKKPLIIHCRDSKTGSVGPVYKDLIEILNTKYLIHNTDLRGVMHSFTGTVDEARQFIDLGLYLGFNGIITFASRSGLPIGPAKGELPTNRELCGQYDEIVRVVPLEMILLETDAPFLTPEPHRGKRNEPAYVIEVAKKVAELKNISLEKVIEQTTDNCKKLFNILP